MVTPIDCDQSQQTLERFWVKVNKSGQVPEHCPELGPCWAWTANRVSIGYGQFWVRTPSSKRRYRPVLAHRFTWTLANGPIPKGLCVLHQCDNPPCCNPAHLHVGDHSKNMQEAWDRGRMANVWHHSGASHWSKRLPERRAMGERNGNVQISDADVARIRASFNPARRGSKAALAREFGTSKTHIGRILAGASRQIATIQ